MFNKILIANRGEIAVRIINTAKRLGITTVAIYSSADANSLFTKLADESYLLGDASPADSYLNIKKIIDIAKQCNAEAIHPGYGFLSENAEFAKACEKAKIKFIGPQSKTIALMGSKAKSKEVMEKAKVPLVPGYHGADQTTKKLKAEAEKIGFPVLIKASLGGGGKGMRIVRKKSEFESALESCKREAKMSFANDDVILEKYIDNPRHIEVQVFADESGNVVHLFERDCSIQRRHQKIVEEAPSAINPDVRTELCESAVRAAKHLNYVNAGTIEFLMDGKEKFYFMEMNTRLQVEHPVTEMITNLDLVEWQLKVAYGADLPLTQAQIDLNGHAIEVRIYAEDPVNDFLPTSGHVFKNLTPRLNHNVRLDTGIIDNDYVDIHYDPMLAKLIVKADTRIEAIKKLNSALKELHYIGIKTNVSFLRKIINDMDFVMSNTSTHYLEKFDYKEYLDEIKAFKLTAAAYFLVNNDHKANTVDSFNNWRLNASSETVLSLIYNNKNFKANIKSIGPNKLEISNIKVNSEAIKGTYTLNTNVISKSDISISINDETFNIALHKYDNLIYTSINSYDFHFWLPDLDYYSVSTQDEKGSLVSPMPGVITKVLVKDGDKVKKDEPLLVLEAMKMEHTITAPSSGKVKSVNCSVGETVEQGINLASIEETSK